MSGNSKKEKQLLQFDSLSDEITVEVYDDDSIDIRDFAGNMITIKKEDLKPLINHLFNNTPMVGGIMVDDNKDKSIDIYRRTGPTII